MHLIQRFGCAAAGAVRSDVAVAGLAHIGAFVEVKDNGEGVPLDIPERIFVPNFTTRGTGMGLGLAMVKRIVIISI